MKRKVKKDSNEESTDSKEKTKAIGLFDHVKHIREVQAPDYYKNLSDTDRKTFSHFMILKVLSMNPTLIEDMSWIFRYFDVIPSEQFYTLLITVCPPDRRFYPWVKSKREKMNKELVDLVARKFEISTDRANEYISMMITAPGGVEELVKICQGYGLNEKDIERVMSI